MVQRRKTHGHDPGILSRTCLTVHSSRGTLQAAQGEHQWDSHAQPWSSRV